MSSLDFKNNYYNSLEYEILFKISFENFLSDNLELRELVVIDLLNDGFSITEIAKHQKCSRRFITRVIKNLRIKILSFLRR